MSCPRYRRHLNKSFVGRDTVDQLSRAAFYISKIVATQPLTLLLIDDVRAESLLMQCALEETGLAYHLSVARDGPEALELLLGNTEGELPALILLADGLPKLNPAQVLAALKENERTRSLPVLFLGSEYEARRAHLPAVDAYSGRLTEVEDYVQLGQKVASLLRLHAR